MKNQIQIAITYISTGLMLYFFILPSYNGSGNNMFERDMISKRMDDQVKAESLSLKAKELSKNGLELQKQYVSFKDTDRKKLDTAIPLGQDIARTINEINDLVESSKVKLLGLTYDNNSDENNKNKIYGPMGVGIQFKGDYESFNNLLFKLERNLRFINIKAVSLVARDDIISGSIQVNVYYFNKTNALASNTTENLTTIDGAINSRVFREIENIYGLANQLGGKIQPSLIMDDLQDTSILIEKQQLTQRANPFANKF